MRVLVTGANGFVGSHIVELLVKSNYSVRCLVRETSDLRWIKDLPVELFYGDINDNMSLKKAVESIDVVCHCAGVLRARDVRRYYFVNQIGTRNLVLAANGSGVKKIVYISSLAAHGPSTISNVRKLSDIPTPVSDYGRSKLEGENEIKRNSKIPWTIIVPSAVYGPRDKDMFSFFKIVHSGFSIRTKKKRVINLTYVEDIAVVVSKCLGSDVGDGKSYYVADPEVYTWEDICGILSDVMDKKTLSLTPPDFLFYLAAFISEKVSGFLGKDAVFNLDKVSEMLQHGWLCRDESVRKDLAVEFTDFRTGAQKTYDWYVQNGWLR